MKNIMTVVLAAIIFAGILIVAPVIGLAVGWLIGWAIELFTGSFATDGLNKLFGTTRFHEGDFPQITAIVGILGSFFKANISAKKAEAK